MKVVTLVAGVGLISLFACSHGAKETSGPAASSAAIKLSGKVEEFTGEIVREDNGYRFKPSDAPEIRLRLSRAKEGAQLESEEVSLRKYFGKTLTVRGIVAGGWIGRAEVLGQWLRPGERSSATLTGPEPKR